MEQGVKYKKGFTLVEAVLVLAVAGLIFAIVFTALPALQVSSRDTDRESDMLKLISEIKNYQTNNRGGLPSGTSVDGSEFDACNANPEADCNAFSGASGTTWEGFYRDYLGLKFMDPMGEYYDLLVVECGANADKTCTDAQLGVLYGSTFTDNNYKIIIAKGATCYGNEAVGSSNPRMVAAVYRLEGSGGVYCANT